MCLLDGPDDGADGRDEREDSGGVLPALVLAVLLAVFRFDIDDVVLLQVEAGRLEQPLLRRSAGHHPLPVLLTDDRHTVHPAPLGDIARLGDGLQQGDAVALHREGAGVAHRAQDGILEIEELQRHQRVLDILPSMMRLRIRAVTSLTFSPSTCSLPRMGKLMFPSTSTR